MGKEISNIDGSAKSFNPQRRSERNLKRNVRLPSLPKVPRNVSKEKTSKTVRRSTKEILSQASREPPVKDNSKKRLVPSISVKDKRKSKRKSVSYEIDCSGINMDTAEFLQDLRNRAENGKLNVAKNVKIKQRGNTILIRSHSYISKKCVRSSIHFLTLSYVKKQKLDRAVHVVGNGSTYKLMYK